MPDVNDVEPYDKVLDRGLELQTTTDGSCYFPVCFSAVLLAIEHHHSVRLGTGTTFTDSSRHLFKPRGTSLQAERNF